MQETRYKKLAQGDIESIEALRGYAESNKFDLFSRQPLDLVGAMSNFTHPIARLAADEVLGFDGSSLTGYQSIHESDMTTVLLPESAFIDRTNGEPKLRVIARIEDPITGERYAKDPVTIAMKAEEYLKSTGLADTAHFGPEAEFFIFDNVTMAVKPNESHFHIDSEEGIWNSGRNHEPNLGYRPDHKAGYSPIPPVDSLEDVRAEMIRELLFNGIEAETGHHEVATAGQGEIDMKYDTLVKMAHNLTWFKHVVKNVANKYGKTATFMPKPIAGDNGSGMHVHQSLWKDGKPLFAGNEYAGLSEMALLYIGGILKHAPALCAITNPTTNSYKRLVPHCEAPTNLVYSARNRSAAVRIPQYNPGNPKAKRIEVRFPDAMASGYLAFPAMLMAGLDGIQNKIDPGEAMDKDIYGLSTEISQNLATLPSSLEEALDALDEDRDFLLQGDVFTNNFIDAWLDLKRADVQELRQIPTPGEFMKYFMG